LLRDAAEDAAKDATRPVSPPALRQPRLSWIPFSIYRKLDVRNRTQAVVSKRALGRVRSPLDG